MFKRKTFASVIITLVLMATAVVAVSSGSIGRTDATWGLVDQGSPDPGADCLRYGDGPVGTVEDPNVFNLSTGIKTKLDDPSIQNGNNTNWNQIRFGMPLKIYHASSGYTYEYPYNPTCWENQGTYNENTYFKYQSGLAFKGVPAGNPRPQIGVRDPFPIGKLCHLNNKVYLYNWLRTTSAKLTINEVSCGENGTLTDKNGNPLPGNPTSINLDYVVPIEFDETPNAVPIEDCPYPSDPGKPCSDAVIPGVPTGKKFYCKYVAENGSENVLEYTLAFGGFTEVSLTGSCAGLEYDQSIPLPGIFISQEGSTNCACVWAQITDAVPLAVQMNTFEAKGGFESIILRWQTAFETDNIGFNIYRGESFDREQAVLLNTELIKSLVPPGSTFGADYVFYDTDTQPYRFYYYWIEDVDVNGEVTLHGPVSAEWVD